MLQILFQSARPVWDAISASCRLLVVSRVSIRASRVGRDALKAGLNIHLLKFQSARPVWDAIRFTRNV